MIARHFSPIAPRAAPQEPRPPILFERNRAQTVGATHGSGPAPGARMSLVTGSLPGNSGAKLTYDDLVDMPDDGLRRELIDGELYVTPAPSIRHQAIVLNIGST